MLLFIGLAMVIFGGDEMKKVGWIFIAAFVIFRI